MVFQSLNLMQSSHPLTSLFRYTIDYANTDPLLQFAVTPDTGLVTVRNSLDRETEEIMTVHILAIDEG
jgi:hypothetical protein